MITLTLFLAALVLLLGSGSLVVTSLTRLAVALRLSAFTAGIVLMSFATTSPELLLGIDAALAGQPVLSLGNVVGTSVVNLGLILGIILIKSRSLALTSAIFRRDLLLAYAIAFLGLLLAADGTVTRLDGLVLLGAFIFWLTHLLHERRALPNDVWNNGPALVGCLGALGRFGVAIVVLLLAASWTVDTGLALASNLAIPPFLLGVLALAVGTSLPELVFALRAIRAGKTQFAVGDLVGATTVTASLVLGVTALLHPIAAPSLGLLILSGVNLLALAIVTLAPLAAQSGRLTATTGWILILIWASFTAGQVVWGA